MGNGEAPPGGGHTGARAQALDSLRGLAAVIVVLHHLHLTVPPTHPALELVLRHTPVRLLVAGRASVMLFFVLSGFVLNLSLAKNASYGEFVVRRIFRIMLPYAVAIALSGALYVSLSPTPVAELTPWFNTMHWCRPVTWATFWRHLFMVDLHRESLSNVAWSLVYELRISLVFPVLALLVRRAGARRATAGALVLFGLLYAALRATGTDRYYGTSSAENLLITAYYVPFFVVGVALSNEMNAVRRVLERQSGARVALGIVLSLGLLASERDVLMGAGAVLLIALSNAHPGMTRALHFAPVRWLGRVSYSLYLVHLTVMLTLFHLFHARVGAEYLLAGSFALSLVAAQLLYVAVEVPSIELGRHAAGLVRRFASA